MEFVVIAIVIVAVVGIGAAVVRRRGPRPAHRVAPDPPTSADADLPVEPSRDVPGSRPHRERQGRP